ncbi:MAG: 4Fe-4S dicluster domain-containing protein [Anaerolineae bacterium]|jgi:heterodisulfide reductase subunit C
MRVRLTAETVHSELVHRVEEYSGQDLMACYQCGKCAAGCPVAFAMDMLPSQVIRYAQLGLVDKLLESKTIWLCAACQTCYTRCPKGIDLSRIMEALREIVMYEQGSHMDYDGLSLEEMSEWPQQAVIGGFRKYAV